MLMQSLQPIFSCQVTEPKTCSSPDTFFLFLSTFSGVVWFRGLMVVQENPKFNFILTLSISEFNKCWVVNKRYRIYLKSWLTGPWLKLFSLDTVLILNTKLSLSALTRSFSLFYPFFTLFFCPSPAILPYLSFFLFILFLLTSQLFNLWFLSLHFILLFLFLCTFLFYFFLPAPFWVPFISLLYSLPFLLCFLLTTPLSCITFPILFLPQPFPLPHIPHHSVSLLCSSSSEL